MVMMMACNIEMNPPSRRSLCDDVVIHVASIARTQLVWSIILIVESSSRNVVECTTCASSDINPAFASHSCFVMIHATFAGANNYHTIYSIRQAKNIPAIAVIYSLKSSNA
jgi:hypothetical protein